MKNSNTPNNILSLLKIIQLKNTFFILIALLLSTLSKAQDIEAELYVTTSYKVAIFPDSFPVKLAGDRFTPTRGEVDQAEKALSRDLFLLNQELENQDRDDVIHRKLLQFKRQYFGYVNDQGEKIIKIIAFIDTDEESDFLTQEKIIVDGTSDNWVVYYNIDTNELYDLAVGRNTNAPQLIQKEPVELKAVDAVKPQFELKKIDSSATEVEELNEEIIE